MENGNSIKVNKEACGHIPVLAAYAESIELKPNAVVADATIGFGGHSRIFAEKLSKDGLLVGFDVDEKSLAAAEKNLAGCKPKLLLIRENFSEIARIFRENGIEKADLIFADLGFCSAQIADREKGLSFMEDMPLDMRLDGRLKYTAADIVNLRDEKGLADLIFNLGQERASRKIARSIVSARKLKKIQTTGELVNIVCRALNCRPDCRKGRLHPATKTFQALRIAVNSELENLEKLLLCAPSLLANGGKIAIIDFHSLEDAIVKNNFRKNKADGIYNIITKKPVEPDWDEIKINPRSRSAKLRIAEKIDNRL